MINLKNIDLDIFDTIGDSFIKVGSHFAKDVKIISNFARKSLAFALKTVGSSNTDEIKKVFVQQLIMAAATNYGQSMTPE